MYEGSSTPLARPDFPVPRVEGEVIPSHGSYLDIPPAKSHKMPESAAHFLARYFAKENEMGTLTTLVATGPLSTVALALKLDPKFKANVRRLVIMGGGHQVANVTASAEANFWRDPEAAHVVLSSGIDEIVLVPLDATHRAMVSSDDCARLRSLGTPAGEATALFVERRIADTSQPMGRSDAAPVHDALCVASLVDPSVISIDKYWVDVETRGQLTLGRSVVDTRGRGCREPNVWVALDADERKFVELLVDTFRSRSPAN